eukprot:CAMPEP_0181509390 /NCGR_PEP_ID=MMETSP1110-20121109/60310_1 /TAXON_ID=174948 /ORGANISM="Symbiodinium sp., Strain CCMP421" /LENGTH=44 /DNA_ID= /DNA_START= /DNA_END= /DNA_ORIENTATION=
MSDEQLPFWQASTSGAMKPEVPQAQSMLASADGRVAAMSRSQRT